MLDLGPVANWKVGLILWQLIKINYVFQFLICQNVEVVVVEEDLEVADFPGPHEQDFLVLEQGTLDPADMGGLLLQELNTLVIG